MVESVESTLHRSRLKARPSSKPSPPSPCEASSFQSNARHSFARFASAASHPRYFIVNSHESQCHHHRVKESFSHPSLSGKQELVGNFHLGRAFSSLDFDSPSLSPPFETRHSPPPPPPPLPNLSLFHFRRESAWNNSGNWRGRIFGETKWS